MKILVCEVQCQRLSYALYQLDGASCLLASGSAAGIGTAEGSYFHTNADLGDSVRIAARFSSWREAVCAMLEHLFGGCIDSLEDIAAVALAGQDGDAADALRSMLPHTALFPVSSSGLSAAQEAAALLGATHRKGE